MAVALVATGLSALFLAGCGKEAPAPAAEAAAEPSSPQSYMNDKPFLARLSEQKKTRQAVMARHMEARRAYEAALKADPKAEQPATKDLKKKMDELEDEYRALRRETMRTVRERITPKQGK